MPDKRIVCAAAVQIAPDLERLGGMLEKVLETIDNAARHGVQLIAFPETFLPYLPVLFIRAGAGGIGRRTHAPLRRSR